MTNQVVQINKQDLEKIKQHYLDYLLPKHPPYSLFAAKKNGVTITGYTSGKIMFQGANAEAEMAQLHLQPATAANAKKSAVDLNKLPADFANWNVLGSDEVGNGSYFGSLVVVATYVSYDMMPQLRALGVKDSKMLTDKEIVAIAAQLEKILPYKVFEITPTKYNEIQPRLNAVAMKVVAHHYVLSSLAKTLPETPDAILVDAFTSEKNFYNYLAREHKVMPLKTYLVTKGEQYHLAVAAASLIARTKFLASLTRGSQETGLTLPSGAGSQSDQVAAKLIKRGGRELLGQYAKLHFANTEKAEKLARK